jgi:isohexenylglutaconyl-CoA hydratase
MSIDDESDPLLLRQGGGRLYATFNRPARRNAMNDAMLLELEHLLTRLEVDRSVRVVVFRGAGGNFCAGGDIRERREQRATSRPGADVAMQRNQRAGRLFLRLANLPQTTVGVVEGYALGGGFGFACTFDITLVRADVQIGMSETRIGVAPAQIAPHVVRRVGLSTARYLALSGRRIDGSEAVHMGVAHEMAHTTAELDERLARLLDDIDACGPLACAATKEIMNHVGEMPLDALIEYAALRFGDLNRGPEGSEGQRAFLEKRKPRWPSLEPAS